MSDVSRQAKILEILRDSPFASVRDLQLQLGVSAATIRRDIDKVVESKSARKVHGGISALESEYGRAFTKSYDENRDLAVEAKRQIAEVAAGMVREGDTIMINGGSTCFQLGVRLADRNIRMFTNSMPLAAYVSENGRCSLTVAGGDLHREPRILYSPQQLQFYASKLFLGAQAISADGLLESHPLLVRSVRELSENVDEIVVLADSRKFRLNARNLTLPLSRVATIITDPGLSQAHADMLQSAGVNVIIAGAEPAE